MRAVRAFGTAVATFFGVKTGVVLVSPSIQSRVEPSQARPTPDDALADVEEHLLACCRALMYANPFIAVGNAMLTGFVMSRLRRSRRRS
jgi:hypothetical protein